MCELVWDELGTFVKKICIRRKHSLYGSYGVLWGGWARSFVKKAGFGENTPFTVYLNSLTTLVHRIAGSERSVEHQEHCIQLGHKGLVKEFGVPHVFRNLCEQHADQIPRAVR